VAIRECPATKATNAQTHGLRGRASREAAQSVAIANPSGGTIDSGACSRYQYHGSTPKRAAATPSTRFARTYSHGVKTHSP
jgi:hypothetical protein